MRSDTKIAIAVRADLAAWQRLNVTAFLSRATGTARYRGKKAEYAERERGDAAAARLDAGR
jgi:hypothetical protein